jgi:hypothetical protein
MIRTFRDEIKRIFLKGLPKLLSGSEEKLKTNLYGLRGPSLAGVLIRHLGITTYYLVLKQVRARYSLVAQH